MINTKETSRKKSKCWILFGSEGPVTVTGTSSILENDMSLHIIMYVSD